MRALLLALALLAPPGVHYQGVQGTGAVAWTPPGGGISTITSTRTPATNNQNGTTGTSITVTGAWSTDEIVLIGVFMSYTVADAGNDGTPSISGGSNITWSAIQAHSTFGTSTIGRTFWFMGTATGSASSQTVTVTYPNTNSRTMWNWIYLETFSGCKIAAPIGATGTNNATASQTASVTVDSSGTGRTGSYITMISGNWNNTRGSVDANSTLVVEDSGTVTNGWVQKRTALVDAGSYTLTRAINTSNDRWISSGIELVAQGN